MWLPWQLFKLAFSHADDSWDIFKCCAGDLPDLHTVDRYTALYVSGSHYSAYEELPWIQQLCSWVQGFAQQQRKAKLLGICFGCQVPPGLGCSRSGQADGFHPRQHCGQHV